MMLRNPTHTNDFKLGRHRRLTEPLDPISEARDWVASNFLADRM
jgi:hypothetical protein